MIGWRRHIEPSTAWGAHAGNLWWRLRQKLAAARPYVLRAWGFFALSNAAAILFCGGSLVLLGLLFFMLGALDVPVLAFFHRRALARWRAVGLTWLSFLLFAWLYQALSASATRWIHLQAATLTLVLACDALLVAVIAVTLLAWYRDVGLTYLAVGYGLGAWAMLFLVRSAGGAEKMFFVLGGQDAAQGSPVAQAIVCAAPCLTTLGIASFVLHFGCGIVREIRRR